jgi:hypothetical protein
VSALVAIATGCSEFRFDPIDREDPAPSAVSVTEVFEQAPLPAVDLLFVMDDTASMVQEQAALAGEFTALAPALDAAGVRWQIGVVGMSGLPFGWLVGSPYLLTPDTPDAGAVLATTTQLGTDGPGPETGFAAALAALELTGPGGPNAGFLRDDAVLHVVFVSDDDDASPELEPDRAAAFVDALNAWSTSAHLPVVSAVSGDLPSGCTSGAGQALPGVAYAAAAEATGGTFASICAADLRPFVAAIADRAVVLDRRFSLVETPLLSRPVTVLVDGVRAEDWTLDAAGPAVEFTVPPPAGSTIEVTYLVEIAL